MKKLLSILAAVGLTATASTAVVACTSIQHLNNPIDSDGNLNFKTKVQIEIGEGSVLTKDGDEYYAIKDSTHLGDVAAAKNPIKGLMILNAPENKHAASNTPGVGDVVNSSTNSDWIVNNKVVWKVKAKDVKSSDIDKDGKVTKTFNAYVEITIPAKENGIWYGYYKESRTWSIVSLDKDSKIATYADVLQIELPAASSPVINGIAYISDDGTTITISGRNLESAKKADLEKIATDAGISGADVSIVNGDLQIKASSKIAAKTYKFNESALDQSTGLYDKGSILGSSSITIK